DSTLFRRRHLHRQGQGLSPPLGRRPDVAIHRDRSDRRVRVPLCCARPQVVYAELHVGAVAAAVLDASVLSARVCRQTGLPAPLPRLVRGNELGGGRGMVGTRPRESGSRARRRANVSHMVDWPGLFTVTAFVVYIAVFRWALRQKSDLHQWHHCVVLVLGTLFWWLGEALAIRFGKYQYDARFMMFPFSGDPMHPDWLQDHLRSYI